MQMNVAKAIGLIIRVVGLVVPLTALAFAAYALLVVFGAYVAAALVIPSGLYVTLVFDRMFGYEIAAYTTEQLNKRLSR